MTTLRAKDKDLLRKVSRHLEQFATDLYECNVVPSAKEKRKGDAIVPGRTRQEYFRIRKMIVAIAELLTRPEKASRRRPPSLISLAKMTDTVATCIGCGCTDNEACVGGCWWIRKEGKRGVCSECPGEAKRFDAGDRKVR